MKTIKQNYIIKIAYSEEYVAQLPAGHKFPIVKHRKNVSNSLII